MSKEYIYGAEGLYDHPDIVIEDMAVAEVDARQKLPEAIQDMESIATLLRIMNEALDEGEVIDMAAIDTLRELFEKYRHEGKFICNSLERVAELHPLAVRAAEIIDDSNEPLSFGV